ASYHGEENDTDPIEEPGVRVGGVCPPQSWPAVAQPYLAPPQTAGDAFFMWTSKTLRVIKIAPAFGSRDQPLWSENGMWEEETR
ncbi:hypothetical protein JOQ06_027177, partial [Pogonophryne albipinna]